MRKYRYKKKLFRPGGLAKAERSIYLKKQARNQYIRTGKY